MQNEIMSYEKQQSPYSGYCLVFTSWSSYIPLGVFSKRATSFPSVQICTTENVLEKSLTAKQKEFLVNSETSVVWVTNSTEYRESSLKHSFFLYFYLLMEKESLAILSTLNNQHFFICLSCKAVSTSHTLFLCYLTIRMLSASCVRTSLRQHG